MHKLGGVYSLFLSNNEICITSRPQNVARGTRGACKGMSRRSKSAMMRFLNSVLFDQAAFVTLTYRYNQQDWKAAYGDLRAWYKRVVASAGGFALVWKQELQSRGAVHFHCFLLDVSAELYAKLFVDEWLSVTGQQGDFAARQYGVKTYGIEALKASDAGVICAYMAKYASKAGGETVGRPWGILGRRYARDTGQRVELSELQGEAIFEYLRQTGRSEFETDGGVCGVRHYLGHIGAGSPSGGGDRIFDDVCKIAFAVVK